MTGSGSGDGGPGEAGAGGQVPWRWLAEVSMHPLQVRIYRSIRDSGPASPVELSRELDEPLSQVSYHVNRARAKGLIELAGTRQVRGTIKHLYRATEVPARYRGSG